MVQNKYKIFVIGPAYPLRGGLATFDELFCRSLNELGHNAQIISYSLQYPDFLFPGSTQYDQSGIAPSGIKIHTLINSVNPLNWIKVAGFIKKEKPDFVVVRYWIPFMGPALGTICKSIAKKGIKVIAVTDNVIPHEKRAGDTAFTKYFIRHCQGFVTMSKAVLNDLQKFTSSTHKKFLLHPLYTAFGEKLDKQEARKKLNISVTDKTILFFGLIRQYKGLDLLLEAMGDARIKQQNIKLLVAGEFYEDKKLYRDIIEKYNLQSNVVLFDKFIPNEEVKQYFSAADLLTLPYRSATQSGVTQVAFQFEKPTLVTNVGGLSEIIPHNKCGYVVEPNATAIADSIIDYFLNNRETAMSAAMKEEKKKYDWSIFSNEIVNLYEDLIK
ncbi:MAG TPA: glycosyltransferase [Bacteroidia bacterium]|jgi:glycosyltransferase involved in cell wall biosynthesis|nr:glycosyltransferase [Bacteroidia bacterium]